MIDYFTDPPVLPGIDYFADPPEVILQGLQHGDCADCNGPALVDARYSGVVRCSACWSRFHNVGAITVPIRSAPRSYVVKPWISQSERGARRIGTASPSESPLPDESAEEVGRYRIVTPARSARPEEIPASCDKLAHALIFDTNHAPDDVRVTYALAEDLKLERPVATVALRLRGHGYALWKDGRPAQAQIADPYLRTCSVTEFTALALGKPYTAPKPPDPPTRGPCPRCGADVRWKKDPFEPWAHNRKDPDQNGAKIKCLPTTG